MIQQNNQSSQKQVPQALQNQSSPDLSLMSQTATEAQKAQAAASAKAEETNATFAKMDQEAIIPVIQTKNSAGADIHSLHRIRLEPGQATTIHTGIRLAKNLPAGVCAIMELRSSLRFKHNFSQLGLGVIDGDYLGEIRGLIFNPGPNSQWIEKGERFAQLIFIKHETATFCEVKDYERKEGGFGSTGTN